VRELSPAQAYGAAWLFDRPGSYLADPPGFGKTAQLLKACRDERFLTVVCPAAIRDARVWEREAEIVGFDAPMTVISYHQLAKTPITPGGALVFDESHRLKGRKVSWAANASKGAAVSTRTHLASGTPTPNGDLTELYAQIRLINPDVPASYWKWIDRWFVLTSNRFTSYYVPGTLLACNGLPCAPAGSECEHRDEFWAAYVGPELMLRRPETELDLPEMAGFEDPLDTPMTPTQKKAYRDLKNSLIASLPEDGITLESLTSSQQFIQLWQASTGLSSVDPEADDKHSGKRALLEELLPDRSHPTVLGVYFRDTAAAMRRMCEDLGLRYEMYGADTPRKDLVIESFQRGDVDVLIASIMVAREGITLTAADQVVLCERSWVPGDNEQMVRRVRRRGQTRVVGVRQLVTPASVDTGQWKALHGKAATIATFMTKAEAADLLA